MRKIFSSLAILALGSLIGCDMHAPDRMMISPMSTSSTGTYKTTLFLSTSITTTEDLAKEVKYYFVKIDCVKNDPEYVEEYQRSDIPDHTMRMMYKVWEDAMFFAQFYSPGPEYLVGHVRIFEGRDGEVPEFLGFFVREPYAVAAKKYEQMKKAKQIKKGAY